MVSDGKLDNLLKRFSRQISILKNRNTEGGLLFALAFIKTNRLPISKGVNTVRVAQSLTLLNPRCSANALAASAKTKAVSPSRLRFGNHSDNSFMILLVLPFLASTRGKIRRLKAMAFSAISSLEDTIFGCSTNWHGTRSRRGSDNV
ncbi:hypothetical protein BC938DRAFT_473451 [Jimgerdemannia flammicorona]|uniref:Uncharacterized protein n=1 Tax=Jimgerdemannia flammicorona TaxID=994334 RepID=A0A433Q462_9FUNG|nr:hypothetical protein BC938DRAFT_473451 [Jimgerdemannia flammicorona]